MVNSFAAALQQKCGLDLSKCGAVGGDYIYLDDILFTGGRVASDLQGWIAGKAPARGLAGDPFGFASFVALVPTGS
jgi:hypothetical protein